jgi:hypothetical protein
MSGPASSEPKDDALLRLVLVILGVAAIFVLATKPAAVSLEDFNKALDADGPAGVYFFSHY